MAGYGQLFHLYYLLAAGVGVASHPVLLSTKGAP